jgi:prevent-host-death family protein
MRDKKWQLQEAKSRFSNLVERVQEEGPKIVTKHGKNSVVVISWNEYSKMIKKETDFVTFLRNSPLSGIELDVTRDKQPPRRVDL